MIQIKFMVYSDIHYHSYQNGLTLYDCRNVEEEINDAASLSNCDCVLFIGDRFLSRNPSNDVRCVADRALKDMCQHRKYVCLIGNHDHTTKSKESSNVYYQQGIYTNDLGGLYVVGLDGWRSFSFSPIVNSQIQLHCLPAGYIHDAHELRPLMSGGYVYSIAMFHDMVNGSRYANGEIVKDHADMSGLDQSHFNLVLGGDNHTPQDLNFKNTHGMYVGAPMAHNWGDAGQKRGYWIITAFIDKRTTTTEIVFIESKAPKFIKDELAVTDYNSITKKIVETSSKYAGNIVRLTLTGTADTLNVINIDNVKQTIRNSSKPRLIDVITVVDEQNVLIPNASMQSLAPSDSQEWGSFVNYSKPSLAGLDVDRILKLGEGFINDDN